MATRNGGSAFPRAAFYHDAAHFDDDHGPQDGMTVRDYFAGQVIAGWGEGYHGLAWKIHERTPDAEAIAQAAYAIADAMIAAREGR